MTVVIDCNILVICLTSYSPYHAIYRSLVAGRFDLAVTNEIMLEYHEIIQQKYGIDTANSFTALLNELPNIVFTNTYYHWQLIQTDPDDNKYCDCAVASRANYIVTEDKHFNVLKTISFPQLNVIDINSFSALL
jgi:putative PIN family toxin of toxin-antitoxin system